MQFHYYTTVNYDGHFTFTAAGIGVRHERKKVTVNRGLTVAGACARCGKWNYHSGQHKVPAAVNPINRSGHLMLPVTVNPINRSGHLMLPIAVNDLKKTKKNLDRPAEPIQAVAAAARETLVPPVRVVAVVVYGSALIQLLTLEPIGPHIGGRATTPAATRDGHERPPPPRFGSWRLLHRIWKERRKNSEMSEKEREIGRARAAVMTGYAPGCSWPSCWSPASCLQANTETKSLDGVRSDGDWMVR